MRRSEESPDDFIRIEEVKRRTSLSKSEVYRRIAEGRFPRSKRLGHRTAVWTVGEIDAWRRDYLVQELLK